jgi:UDP-glucose 4-epimerase
MAAVYGSQASMPVDETAALAAVARVALGKRPLLNVYGGDWPTPDGTGIRDYIRVVDADHWRWQRLNPDGHR